jgi:hypothetical protein
VADAEDAALELPEPGAERHVEALEDHPADLVGVVAVRHHHAGQDGRQLARVEREHLEAPRLDGGARGGGVARMAGEGGRQPLLAQQHRERLAQAVEQVRRRRIGPEAGLVGLDDRPPVPVGARGAGVFGGRERLRADRVEAQAGGQHQALLGAAHGDVDAPLLVAVVDRAERGDDVDEQQCVMALRVDRGAELGDPARHAGRGLVVDDHHRADPALGVGREDLGGALGVGAVAPVALDPLDLEPEALGHRPPQRREVAGLEREHAVAGRQGVDERRLPRAGAGGGVDDDRAARLEDPAQALEDLEAQAGEVGPAMVDRGRVDRPQDAVRDVRRPGDLEEMPSAAMRHRWCRVGITHPLA